jgi:2-octaprenyl-6-methoxyphenol hydroxylase
MSSFDVAIVGGGMVGASLALALGDTGVSAVLIESTAPDAQVQPSFDDRATALGNASRRIFQALGVWPAIAPEAAPIRTIHVSDAGRFGVARLRAQEQGIDAFGYVVANRVIGKALWRKLTVAKGLTLRVPARPEAVQISDEGVRLTVVPAGGGGAASRQESAGASEEIAARLVVAADGAHSSVRAAAGIEADVEDYDQVAIVANIGTDTPQEGTAYERFTPSGPLALLPLFDGSFGVVWTAKPDYANELLAASDADFLRDLQSRFGWRAGRFVRVGRRASYPLKLSRAVTTVATRTVLIGNAAQALHPVAGQGFNLGLRDAAMLAEIVANAVGPAHSGEAARSAARDPGSPELLRQFSQWRGADRTGVTRFTDSLVKLFGDARPGIGVLRNLGLVLFDLTPPAKSALARVSAGFGGPTPRLARGLQVR